MKFSVETFELKLNRICRNQKFMITRKLCYCDSANISGRIIFSVKLGYDGIVAVRFGWFIAVTFGWFIAVRFGWFIAVRFGWFIAVRLEVTINVSEAELDPWVATT